VRTERCRNVSRPEALVLYWLENSGGRGNLTPLVDRLRREFPGFLTRDADKELFDDILKRPTQAASDVSTQ
jgi:hypothetical protein